MAIIAENLTASGIYIEDLSGLYIPASGTADLLEYFDLGRIMLSLDLNEQITDENIRIFDGTMYLNKEQSLEQTIVETKWEARRVYTFLDLLDTPPTYSGIGYKYLQINDDESGIEFTPIGFLDLHDTPPTYSGYDGMILAVNSGQTGFDYVDPPGYTFISLVDTPTTYSGNIGKGLRVKADGGLEYTTLATARDYFTELLDTPTTYSGYEGYNVSVKSDGSGLEFTTTSGADIDEFIELIDTPSTYITYGRDFVTVKEDESGLEFTDLFTVISGFMFFREVSDETTSSTTSTSWQEKVSFDIDDLPAGKYRIGWHYEWQYKHGSFEFKARIQVDNSTTIHEFFQEPENVNSWYTESGFRYVTLTEDDHTIDVDYCGTKSGKVARIRAVRLEFWRVA